MPVDNTFLIRRFEKFEFVYVLFSRVTSLPYVECDEDTFDDQIFIFTDEQRVKDKIDMYAKDQIMLMPVKVTGPQLKPFLSGLFAIGINYLVVEDEGAPIRIELEKAAQKPDIEKMKKEQIPGVNPELQLSSIYLLQESARRIERTAEEKKALHDLEEEMAANLIRSKLILADDISDIRGPVNAAAMKNPNNLKKIKIPMVKSQNDDLFRPVYTDAGNSANLPPRTAGQSCASWSWTLRTCRSSCQAMPKAIS